MSEAANRIVQKLWSYCNVLRDDGLSQLVEEAAAGAEIISDR